MGYTHYWTQTKKRISKAAWKQICEDLRTICDHAEHVQGVPLAKEYNEGGVRPFFGPDHLTFNGIGDDGHETFYIERSVVRAPRYPGENPAWAFCKTARKPYDIAVVAALCYLCSVAETHTASSDGDLEDWTAGLEMARLALPRYANTLDYPMEMLRAARWEYSTVPDNPAGYGCGASKREQATHPTIRFCVDGRAYVFLGDDVGPAVHCWPTHAAALQWMIETREGGYLPTHIREAVAKGYRARLDCTSDWEPNIWNPTGSFDKDRWARLRRMQRAAFTLLLNPGDVPQPPAYVRPGNMVQIAESDDAIATELGRILRAA